MFGNALLLGVACIVAALLFHPKVRFSRNWRATVTPLASIIGSGFLVAAPLLSHAVNGWAFFAMAGIVMLAYGIGEVIRFNIHYGEPLLNSPQAPPLLLNLERLSSLTLSIAYVISVAFYLRLLASFLLHAMDIENDVYANILTTGVLLSIAFIGLWRGLEGLEKLEESAVNIKLAIITSLLLGLIGYDLHWLTQPENQINYAPLADWPHAMRLLAGILLIVQGFETSRYLGDEYDAQTRIRTMRFAQLLSAAIYLLFIGLSLPLLNGFHEPPSETAIITLSAMVSPMLPAMLIVAAVMSQFSAAVADTAGSGGLLAEFSRRRFSPRLGYALVVALAIVLIWSANIFEIITIASRAFATYYLLQCLVALCINYRRRHWLQSTGFLFITCILLLVLLFAIPDGA